MGVLDATPATAATPPQTVSHENNKKTDVEEERHLVDNVAGWLRVYSDGSVERTWTGPPDMQLIVSPYFPSPSATAADGVSLYDLCNHTPSELSLRIYIPAAVTDHEGGEGNGEGEARSRFPVLLHFHGGGFCISRPSWYMYYQFYARLARATGAAVVSVYTRPAPEHRLPAAVDDCFSGLLWLHSLARSALEPIAVEAGEEHPAIAALLRFADFSRVFLIGDSSGGNLVHEVAARAGREDKERGGGFWAPLRVAGAVPIHPGFVRATRIWSEMDRQFESPLLTLEMVDKLLALALPEESTKDHPITCPMGWAAPPMEELQMPPLLVAVAEQDLMRDTQMEYCDALRAAGKDVEVLMSAGVSHCFYLNKVAVDSDAHVGEQTAALIAAIKDFMDRH